MRPFLLLLAGCSTWVALDLDDTGTGADTDTGSDTDADGYVSTRVVGMRGTAFVNPDAGTWAGASTVYDEIETDHVDVLCALDFASVGVPDTTCGDCQFAFAVEHTEAIGRTGEQCDQIWPIGDPMTDPTFWDVLVGYDPTGPDGSPCLMVFIDAWTDSGGNYHEASWQPAHTPWGSASFDATIGAFSFDYAIEISQEIFD